MKIPRVAYLRPLPIPKCSDVSGGFPGMLPTTWESLTKCRDVPSAGSILQFMALSVRFIFAYSFNQSGHIKFTKHRCLTLLSLRWFLSGIVCGMPQTLLTVKF